MLPRTKQHYFLENVFLRSLSTWTFILMALCHFSLFSTEFRQAQIEQISFSGRSFALNRGSFHGVKKDAVAEFVWFDSKSNEWFSLGRAQAMNVINDRSYWFFETFRQDVIVEAPVRVEFVLRDELKGSLRPFQVRQNQVILDKGVHPIRYFVERQSLNPDDLVVNTQYDQEEFILEDDRPTRAQDITVFGFDEWYESRNLEILKEFNERLPSRHPRGNEMDEDFVDEEIQKIEEVAYKSILDAYLRHSPYVRDKRENFFYNIRPDDYYPQIQKTITNENVFQRYQREKVEGQLVSPRVRYRTERDGELWSSDMNEEELRHYFIQTGLKQELERQKRALGRRHSSEISFEFSTPLVTTANNEDPNLQGTNYSLGVHYEFHLVRTSEALTNWGLTLGLERSIAFYDIGGFNAIFSEGHFGLGVHYYFYNYPSLIDKIIGYVAVGIKRGNGDLRSANLIEDYDVQSLRFPFYLGFKYRFSGADERQVLTGVGWGLNFKFGYEVGEKNVLGFSEEDFNKVINPGVFTAHFGLSTYF